MRYIKRVVTTMIAICMIYSVVAVESTAASLFGRGEEASLRAGSTRTDNGLIDDKIDRIFSALRIPQLDIAFTGELDEIADDIYENSRFDVNLYTGNIPDFLWLSRSVSRRLELPVSDFRELLNARADKLDESGRDSGADLLRFVSVVAGQLEKIYICCGETKDGYSYPVCLELYYVDGSRELIDTGSVYDKKAGKIYGTNGKGVLNLGYDLLIDDMVLCTPVDVWMRSLGFCRFYDIAANSMPALYDYDTVRLKFEYDGADWMIQLWKGKYYVTNGAEVGLYKKPKYRLIEFYNCAGDEDLLKMSLKVKAEGKTIINVAEQPHWWINGFALNDRYYDASEMAVTYTAVMKDMEMLNAVKGALEKNEDILSYSIDGLKITVKW